MSAPLPESDNVIIERIRHGWGTARFISVVIGTTVFACLVVICTTILVYKYMDDPPWLQLVKFICSLTCPAGGGSTVVLVIWYLARRNLRTSSNRVQSLLESPNGHMPPSRLPPP